MEQSREEKTEQEQSGSVWSSSKQSQHFVASRRTFLRPEDVVLHCTHVKLKPEDSEDQLGSVRPARQKKGEKKGEKEEEKQVNK